MQIIHIPPQFCKPMKSQPLCSKADVLRAVSAANREREAIIAKAGLPHGMLHQYAIGLAREVKLKLELNDESLRGEALS